MRMNEKKKKVDVKHTFRKLYKEDFEDPCEDFVDALYDVVPNGIIENELKKIKNMKVKHGSFYLTEKSKKTRK